MVRLNLLRAVQFLLRRSTSDATPSIADVVGYGPILLDHWAMSPSGTSLLQGMEARRAETLLSVLPEASTK